MIRFLLGLVITIVLIPIFLLLALLDFSPDAPVDVYSKSSVEAIMETEINNAIEGIADGTLSISLGQDNLNNLIYNQIIEGYNENYYPGETCTDSECKYVYSTDFDLNG